MSPPTPTSSARTSPGSGILPSQPLIGATLQRTFSIRSLLSSLITSWTPFLDVLIASSASTMVRPPPKLSISATSTVARCSISSAIREIHASNPCFILRVSAQCDAATHMDVRSLRMATTRLHPAAVSPQTLNVRSSASFRTAKEA
eukprot:CAMPEP_0169436456 /NCGR_PEP_ID=MMETSP1042-20121227/5598_1 /TAXON_ID=464988 /ORGANISM="Hemiselmis andersenii, Strain CCMP1180" /LENGTH=145 /DNA_ID=CAMNT_0009547151 /DNA_START=409 /DNA_END=846 /DNA_ORIENTATION=-